MPLRRQARRFLTAPLVPAGHISFQPAKCGRSLAWENELPRPEGRGIRFFFRKICRWIGNYLYCAVSYPTISAAVKIRPKAPPRKRALGYYTRAFQ
jgi:hypothetical protein